MYLKRLSALCEWPLCGLCIGTWSPQPLEQHVGLGPGHGGGVGVVLF